MHLCFMVLGHILSLQLSFHLLHVKYFPTRAYVIDCRHIGVLLSVKDCVNLLESLALGLDPEHSL
jgi:hypothetical protein